MKQIISTSKAPSAIGVYSQAVKAGNTVYISGQIPLDPDTMAMIKGDFKARVIQVFRNIKAIAQAAGGDLHHVVKLTVFLTDENNFSLVNEVMLDFFSSPFPARAMIVVKALPRNADIEVEATLWVSE